MRPALRRQLDDTWIWALQPSATGLERTDMGGLFRLEDDARWTPLATRPPYSFGFVPTSANERRWFGEPDETPALLDMATARWRLPADPSAVPPMLGIRAVFTVEDQPFVIGASTEDGTETPVLHALTLE